MRRTRTLPALALAVACAISAGIGITLWSFGSGLAPDSVTYLDAAQSIAQAKGLRHRWVYWEPAYQAGTLPTATTLWPPGYPLAIAALVTLGFDPYFAGRLICLLSLAILPFPIYGLAQFLLPPARALICTAVVMALSPVLRFSFFVVAESPFLLLATLSLLCTIRALHVQTDREGTRLWLMASAAAGAAFLVRYVGVACVAGVAISALLLGAKRSLGTRAWHLVVAAGPAGLLVAAVFLRNYLVSGSLVAAAPGSDQFWSTLWPSVRAIVASLIGDKGLLGPDLSFLRPLQLGLLTSLTGLALVSLWRARTVARTDDLPLPGALASGVICLFIILGVAVPVYAVARLGVSLEARYVTIYLPWCFLLLLGWGLRVDDHDSSASRAGVVRRCAYVACLLWALLQLGVLTLYFSSYQEGYVAAGSRSTMIAWVRMNVAPTETILTNRGAALAYWSPNPILLLPRPPFSKGVASWNGIDRLATKVRARYLVHFFAVPATPKWYPEGFPFLRQLDTPEAFPDRHPILFTDGAVYHVGPSNALGPEASRGKHPTRH